MSSFLIKDVRIFDGESVIENGSVLVKDGKISRVSSTPIQYDGTIHSKPGHTLIPGLIDVHIHADSGNEVALPQSLGFGCTTVCDMSNEYHNIVKLRKQLEGGNCADLKTASQAATVEMGWPMPVVLKYNDTPEVRRELATWPKLVTAEDAKQYIQDRLKEHVDYIKLMHESGTVMGEMYNKPSLELQKTLIDEAHKAGLVVVAHATCLQDTLEILQCGVDGLTHTFVDQTPTQELLDAYKKADAHCNPTLSALGSLTDEGKSLQEKYAHDPRVQHLISEEGRGRMCACMSMAQKAGATTKHAYESVRRLKEAGVPILVGSDAAGPAVGTGWGLSVHMELALLVNECGFTPEEALVSATYLPAKRFNFSDRGQIKEGLRADIVLIEGNPLDNIDRTLDLRGVWTAGELCITYEGKL